MSSTVHRISSHFHTIQKSRPRKTWESHFFNVSITELIIISTCFGKGKVFSKNSNPTNLVEI